MTINGRLNYLFQSFIRERFFTTAYHPLNDSRKALLAFCAILQECASQRAIFEPILNWLSLRKSLQDETTKFNLLNPLKHIIFLRPTRKKHFLKSCKFFQVRFWSRCHKEFSSLPDFDFIIDHFKHFAVSFITQTNKM